MTSPAETENWPLVSVSLALLAVEFRLAGLAPPVPLTTAVSLTRALTQALARVSVPTARVLVKVQVISPGVAPMVSTLPLRVPPVQDRAWT